MVAFLRSSERCFLSVDQTFVWLGATLWYVGHDSCVKCLSCRPLKWPIESQPSTGHLRSSITVEAFFGGVLFVFTFGFFVLPLVRLTGLLDRDRLLSASDSDASEAFAGVKTAERIWSLLDGAILSEMIWVLKLKFRYNKIEILSLLLSNSKCDI